MIQQRLRTVMTGSHIDSVRVQDRADIVGVYAVYDKIQNAVMFASSLSVIASNPSPVM